MRIFFKNLKKINTGTNVQNIMYVEYINHICIYVFHL